MKNQTYALLSRQSISLVEARAIALRVANFGEEKKLNFSVAITGSDGSLVHFERADLAPISSIDAAIQKAHAANAFRQPTRVFFERIKEGRLDLLSLKGICAVAGGVPILRDGQHIGAVGISGATSKEDDECAVYAIDMSSST